MKATQRKETRLVSREIPVIIEKFEFDEDEVKEILWAHVQRQKLGSGGRVHDIVYDDYQGYALEVIIDEEAGT